MQGQEMAGSGLRYRMVGDNDVELGVSLHSRDYTLNDYGGEPC